MSKGAIAEALATGCELKKSVCAKVLDVLAEVATAGVKKSGVFAVPGLCRLKIRTKPATKAGKREIFGKVVMVKAKAARKALKAKASKMMFIGISCQLTGSLGLGRLLLPHPRIC